MLPYKAGDRNFAPVMHVFNMSIYCFSFLFMSVHIIISAGFEGKL